MIETLIYSFITAFAITYLAIPVVIKIAKRKKLFDVANSRKSHRGSIPTLGGIAIFAGLIFSLTFWTKFSHYWQLQYIVAALLIVSLLGIKDDIDGLSPLKKLIGEILAAVIITVWGDIRITSMFGIFGIHEIPYIVSILFSIFTIIVIVNSLNLIDGINGLSGSIGVISSIIFGTWFFFVDKNSQLAIVAFALVGALTAFLKYNITPAKIFMGDTGSLALGLILSVFAIEFIEINKLYQGNYHINHAPVVAIAILFFPLFDLLRSFSIRIAKGHSPFKPDRNHIHHMLIDLGLSHTLATIIIDVFSIIIIFIALIFRDIGTYILGFSILIFAILITSILYYFVKKKKKN